MFPRGVFIHGVAVGFSFPALALDSEASAGIDSRARVALSREFKHLTPSRLNTIAERAHTFEDQRCAID